MDNSTAPRKIARSEPDPVPAGLRQLPNARRLGADAPDLPHEPQAGVGTKAEVMCTPQENAYCVAGSSRAVMPTHQWPRLSNSPGRAAVFFFWKTAALYDCGKGGDPLWGEQFGESISSCPGYRVDGRFRKLITSLPYQ